MRVIKLGGSLLDIPDLGLRLLRFFHELTPHLPTLILVGGGAMVDVLREHDKRWKLDEVDCHWLSVQLMNSTARLLHLLIPAWPLITNPQALHDWLSGSKHFDSQITTDVSGNSSLANESKYGLFTSKIELRATRTAFPAIVAPDAFYSQTINASSLPLSWQTTSDSISALLATQVHAEQLILLKSVDPPTELVELLKLYSCDPQFKCLENKPVDKTAVEHEFKEVSGDFLDNAFLNLLTPSLNVEIVNFRSWKSCKQ